MLLLKQVQINKRSRADYLEALGLLNNDTDQDQDEFMQNTPMSQLEMISEDLRLKSSGSPRKAETRLLISPL